MRVIVFAGGFNLPIWVAQEQGFFARENITVELTPTPGSVYQMTHLISGEFDIAHTAMDNVVAYAEGEGEVPVEGQPDLVAFIGGDNGFLRLISRPEIHTYADLKGKQLAVDAVTTGYAFVLRKMLEVNGLREEDYTVVPAGGVQQRWQALLKGEYAGTLLISPFEVLAQQQGCNLLGSAVDVLGRYQGLVGATRRSWATPHRDELVGYIRAYIAALDWLYEPAHREGALKLLMMYANMAPALAAEAYRVLVDPVRGFTPGARLDSEGIQRLLALRSRYAPSHRTLRDPAKYVVLEYYGQAMGKEPW